MTDSKGYFGGVKTAGLFMLLFLLIVSVISLSFLSNIMIHEFGHYAAAKSFGLKPSMHFFDPLYGDDGKLAFDMQRLNSEPVAYTQFTATHNLWESVNITIAGIMMNLLFAVFICFVYTYVKRTPMTELVFLCFLVPTLISALINLNVFSAASDGGVLLQCFVA